MNMKITNKFFLKNTNNIFRPNLGIQNAFKKFNSIDSKTKLKVVFVFNCQRTCLMCPGFF